MTDPYYPDEEMFPPLGGGDMMTQQMLLAMLGMGDYANMNTPLFNVPQTQSLMGLVPGQNPSGSALTASTQGNILQDWSSLLFDPAMAAFAGNQAYGAEAFEPTTTTSVVQSPELQTIYGYLRDPMSFEGLVATELQEGGTPMGAIGKIRQLMTDPNADPVLKNRLMLELPPVFDDISGQPMEVTPEGGGIDWREAQERAQAIGQEWAGIPVLGPTGTITDATGNVISEGGERMWGQDPETGAPVMLEVQSKPSALGKKFEQLGLPSPYDVYTPEDFMSPEQVQLQQQFEASFDPVEAAMQEYLNARELEESAIRERPGVNRPDELGGTSTPGLVTGTPATYDPLSSATPPLSTADLRNAPADVVPSDVALYGGMTPEEYRDYLIAGNQAREEGNAPTGYAGQVFMLPTGEREDEEPTPEEIRRNAQLGAGITPGVPPPLPPTPVDPVEQAYLDYLASRQGVLPGAQNVAPPVARRNYQLGAGITPGVPLPPPPAPTGPRDYRGLYEDWLASGGQPNYVSATDRQQQAYENVSPLTPDIDEQRRNAWLTGNIPVLQGNVATAPATVGGGIRPSQQEAYEDYLSSRNQVLTPMYTGEMAANPPRPEQVYDTGEDFAPPMSERRRGARRQRTNQLFREWDVMTDEQQRLRQASHTFETGYALGTSMAAQRQGVTPLQQVLMARRMNLMAMGMPSSGYIPGT